MLIRLFFNFAQNLTLPLELLSKQCDYQIVEEI
jgi:hypothetical protein